MADAIHNRGETQIDGWALDVIETLIRATDDNGLKVALSHEVRRQVLARVIEYNDAMDADMKPGGGFYELMAGLAEEGTRNV